MICKLLHGVGDGATVNVEPCVQSFNIPAVVRVGYSFQMIATATNQPEIFDRVACYSRVSETEFLFAGYHQRRLVVEDD